MLALQAVEALIALFLHLLTYAFSIEYSPYSLSRRVWTMAEKYVFSDRRLRKILKRVDRQRVIGLPGQGTGRRPHPMVEYGIPYSDEEFMCGLLTCEFRGWVERFGDEVPIQEMPSGNAAYQSLFRITQAGRAVLDRTQQISNWALLVAFISLLISSLAFATGVMKSVSEKPPSHHHHLRVLPVLS